MPEVSKPINQDTIFENVVDQKSIISQRSEITNLKSRSVYPSEKGLTIFSSLLDN